MEVYEALTLLREKAVKDPALRKDLLETGNSRTPLSDFCRLSTQAGIELYEMDLLSAGEDYLCGHAKIHKWRRREFSPACRRG